jgi:Ankyrin repeats (3 copies)
MRLACCCASLLTLLATSAAGRDAARLSLGDASRVGDVAQVKALIAAGADLNARDAQARTPLLQAVEAGRGVVVTLLLKAGADVDASDNNGLTPLIAATRLANEDLARSLLDAGADTGMRHRALGTALDVAEHGASPALVRLLRERGARGSGHSVGDLVCVRPWDGDGFCGRVLEVSGPRFHLRVERLVGCEDGCAPRDCSAQRPLGGRNAGALGPGDSLWVDSACLTHTGLTD